MAEEAPRRAWLSAHLRYSGEVFGAAADRVLLDVVAPVADRCRERGWVRRFFFVRYSDRGPHVRFRLLGSPAVLAERVRPELLAVAAGRVREVSWEPYEPELERYGGAAGVAVAEQFFDASSRAALGLLAKLPPDDRPARLGKALLAALAALEVFLGERERAAALMADFATGYLRQLEPREERFRAWNRTFERGIEEQTGVLEDFVESAWTALAEGDELPPEVAAYRGDLRRVRRRLQRLVAAGVLRVRGRRQETWKEAVGALLPSYLHMTNNRLGITQAEETYLLRAMATVLAPPRRASA